MASARNSKGNGTVSAQKIEYSKHFEYFTVGSVWKARCRYCQPEVTYNRNRGTTTGMKYHMETKHMNTLEKEAPAENVKAVGKKCGVST